MAAVEPCCSRQSPSTLGHVVLGASLPGSVDMGGELPRTSAPPPGPAQKFLGVGVPGSGT